MTRYYERFATPKLMKNQTYFLRRMQEESPSPSEQQDGEGQLFMRLNTMDKFMFLLLSEEETQ